MKPGVVWLVEFRAGKTKSLIHLKRLKGGKGEFDLQLDFWQKKYLISGDVINPESEGSALSHNNRFQKNYNFKMLITFERKVPQSSYTSQNDHKSKGYPSKTFTMQKADECELRRLEHPPLK